ncbi:MAG TPA: histidine kinase [Vicinamibacteria bacterium]|nr:histidine kinase [Vicinamibacteria bacterium]
MHPILAERGRLGAYLAAWGLLGLLLAALLVLSAPFGWIEATVFAVPLAVLYGFMGLASFWVCQAAPLPRGLARAFGMQLPAGVASGFMWLAAGRGFALALDRAAVFPGLQAKQAAAAPLLLGLGVALYLLAATIHYMIVAFETSREAERRALEFEIASREAELRALRAQIHPHFLFNSLNSINALIAARPEEARQLCVRLADFLRRSLTVGSREAIPLAEELDLAEQLFSIEKVRFGDRLSHVVVADDAARACPVPPLVLQPLVENAVTHGVAQMLDGGEIRIEAERRGSELRIVIVNPRDSDAPRRKGTGIGLQNVRRRLFTLHGDAAEVRVVPGDSSFRVELRLPAGR